MINYITSKLSLDELNNIGGIWSIKEFYCGFCVYIGIVNKNIYKIKVYHKVIPKFDDFIFSWHILKNNTCLGVFSSHEDVVKTLIENIG
jgi:hypothetical protein